MMTSYWVSQMVYVAAKLGIADTLAEGPRQVGEIARAVRADASALMRLLRALVSVGVFTQLKDGRVALTEMGHHLRNDVPESMRSLAVLFCEPWYWRPWEELLYSVKTGRPAWNKVHGIGQFEYFERNSEANKIFNDAMTDLTVQMHTAALRAYDFGRFRQIVDIGGGNGALLSAILSAHPAVRGVLFDQPHVIERARVHLREAGVAPRCAVAVGDFLKSVPRGGDAYILAHILHDWDDARALVILKNIRDAMAKQGKILIFEQVIPEDNEPYWGKLMDITMLVVLGGRERTRREFATLLGEAGLRLSTLASTASPVSVVEAVRR